VTGASGLASSGLRLQIALFLVAVPLHLVWEVAQMPAYAFPRRGILADVVGCFVPSLGDGLMTLLIFWTGWLVFRELRWIVAPGRRGYVLMAVVGAVLAVAVEWNALYRTGAWAYGSSMPVVPGLGVGLVPLLQMVVLPPVTARIVAAMKPAARPRGRL
jgi:hypothetical protein